ncbi:class I SAM-dependent methyltransferase [Senegalia massiliensis]|uniref:class I SAM-dependent methyltransferase n=1 Tax=Senegalia massiliensis TaxID=1720316 RepID=UPI001031E264|nr:class I SAM-dependent methyltransferase [Senegalia massiliensis]
MYNVKSQSLDRAFQEYDKLISDYPIKIFWDMMSCANLKLNSNILEIGSGTGKATKRLLDLKFNNINCIEREYELASYMDKKFRGNINIYISSFEEWQGPNEKYDIIICANSFQYLNRDISMTKIQSILKRQGTLALIWTSCPSFNYSRDKIFDVKNDIVNNYKFYDVETKIYNWHKIYTEEEYIKFLNMQNYYYLLEEKKKQEIYYKVIDNIKENNTIKINYELVLLLLKNRENE